MRIMRKMNPLIIIYKISAEILELLRPENLGNPINKKEKLIGLENLVISNV